MQYERKTMAQLIEIQRLIRAGQADRQIALVLYCRRSYVAKVRSNAVNGEVLRAARASKAFVDPPWI